MEDYWRQPAAPGQSSRFRGADQGAVPNLVCIRLHYGRVFANWAVWKEQLYWTPSEMTLFAVFFCQVVARCRVKGDQAGILTTAKLTDGWAPDCPPRM